MVIIGKGGSLNIFDQSLAPIPKGQLISEWLFSVLNFLGDWSQSENISEIQLPLVREEGTPEHLRPVVGANSGVPSLRTKAGWISEMFSLWLQSPKNVPNHYPELYLAAKEKILRVKEEQSGGTVDPVGHLIMLCVPLILCKM